MPLHRWFWPPIAESAAKSSQMPAAFRCAMHALEVSSGSARRCASVADGPSRLRLQNFCASPFAAFAECHSMHLIARAASLFTTKHCQKQSSS